MKAFVAILAILSAMVGVANSKAVMCYFASWAYEREGTEHFEVENIDPFLCTHLLYAFAVLDEETWSIAPMSPGNDLSINDGNAAYQRFNALKEVNPDLVTLLSVGGWGDGSAKYSELVSTPERRRNFIDSSVAFLTEHGFSGLDLDWEYPGGRFDEEGLPNDKENYAALLREMRAEFDNHGFLLTAAVGADQIVIDRGYDIPAMAETLDFINLMAYDFHGWFEGQDYTAHHSPLFATPEEVDPMHPGYHLNSDWAINYWLSGGARKEQLVIGVGAYGRGFVLKEAGMNGLYAEAVGPINEEGVVTFSQFCKTLYVDGEVDMWTVVRDPNVVSPYAFKGTDWLGYDDVVSIQAKSQYVLDNDLGGAMIWAMDEDDFNGFCGAGPFPLVTKMAVMLN